MAGNSPTSYRSLSGSSGRIPENGGVRESVPRLWGPSGPGLQSVQTVSNKCPEHVSDTPGTLFGHSGARRARRAPGTPCGTLYQRDPVFRDVVTRPKYPSAPPPYRETGVAIPLSHCVSCGIADQCCYTPTSFLNKNGLSQSAKTGIGRRLSQKSWPLKRIARRTK